MIYAIAILIFGLGWVACEMARLWIRRSRQPRELGPAIAQQQLRRQRAPWIR